jgi:hypothetical protein
MSWINGTLFATEVGMEVAIYEWYFNQPVNANLPEIPRDDEIFGSVLSVWIFVRLTYKSSAYHA